MLGRLLLLFIIVPAIELILLIQVGQLIGTLPTIGLIIFTGMLGAFLARLQGMQVLARLRDDLQKGGLPTEAIFDGAVILIAGAFLMTPGVLTDALGFLCLIPATRRLIKKMLWSRLQRMVQNGQIFTNVFIQGQSFRPRPPQSDEGFVIDHDDVV